MTVQDTNQNTAAGENKPDAADAPGAPSGSLETLSQAELASMVKSLRAENGKHRTKANEAADVAAKAAAEKISALEAGGEWEKLAKERHALLESATQTVKDLTSKTETLSAKAKRWDAYEKAETARIVEAAKALPDDDRALLNGVTDLSLRARMLDRLKGAATQSHDEPTHPPPADSNGKDVSIEALIKQGKGHDWLMKNHPAEYNAYLDATPTPNKTGFSGMFLRS